MDAKIAEVEKKMDFSDESTYYSQVINATGQTISIRIKKPTGRGLSG